MKNIKQMKSQRGFTLVEVIVVAIIVAALAGVAIPMYTSYVKSSRENGAANAAGSTASYMGSCLTQGGTVTGTGIAENTEATGTTAVPLSLSCNATTPPSTMKLPPGIKFTITKFSGTAGGAVTAQNPAAGSDPQTYNY